MNTVCEQEVKASGVKTFARRAGSLAFVTALAVSPALASTAPEITVDYGAFGTGVVGEVQKMLTAVLPAVAVLFGTMKGIMWVRAIL